MLEIVNMVLGPVETNAYLVGDTRAGEAVVIDPAWDGEEIAAEAKRRGWRISGVWVTHAHFDHIGGAGALARLPDAPPVAMHAADLPLWRAQGGAPLFGMHIDPGPTPGLELVHGQKLNVGEYEFEVRHAPGHTAGHVMFYCAQQGVMFCGDVIFYSGIGRTDLPGGSYQTLLRSIQAQILTLPDETRLFSGHGPETTVGHEKRSNPFL